MSRIRSSALNELIDSSNLPRGQEDRQKGALSERVHLIREDSLHRLDHIHFVGSDSLATPPRDCFPRRRAAVPFLPVSTRIASRFADSVTVDPLLIWMLRQSGLAPEMYRPSSLQRRLPACLRQLRATTGEEGRRMLEQQPELLPKALNTLLIGMTGFFRDPGAFERLSALLDERLKKRPGLRVYSAGCSDGRELYSIAMLLEERGALAQSRLIGLDCRSQAIYQAREGLFAADDLEGLQAKWRERHFLAEGKRFRVKSKLRFAIEWRQGDLFSHREKECDLILFRNVAIYLRPAHGAAAWEGFDRQLAAGGLLVTGKAEKPTAALGLRLLSPSIYQKGQALPPAAGYPAGLSFPS